MMAEKVVAYVDLKDIYRSIQKYFCHQPVVLPEKFSPLLWDMISKSPVKCECITSLLPHITHYHISKNLFILEVR